MPDPMDLVREFYRALNASDLDRLASLYHPSCIVEHLFVADDGVYESRDLVRLKWAAEFAACAGALPGGHRVEVGRIAGIQTGWGWVRADWTRAQKDLSTGIERRDAGHSHFWIEDGLIRRHRSVLRTTTPAVVSQRPVVGVGAVILVADGGVVLIKRSREPLAGQWSLPGGTLELGETLETGVAREILEETGLVVDVGPVIEVFDRILEDDDGAVRYHFVLVDYLCTPRGGELKAGSDAEAVALADPASLAEYRMAEKACDVIARAVVMARTRSA